MVFCVPMTVATKPDLVEYCRETARRAKAASAELAVASGEDEADGQ